MSSGSRHHVARAGRRGTGWRRAPLSEWGRPRRRSATEGCRCCQALVDRWWPGRGRSGGGGGSCRQGRRGQRRVGRRACGRRAGVPRWLAGRAARTPNGRSNLSTFPGWRRSLWLPSQTAKAAAHVGRAVPCARRLWTQSGNAVGANAVAPQLGPRASRWQWLWPLPVHRTAVGPTKRTASKTPRRGCATDGLQEASWLVMTLSRPRAHLTDLTPERPGRRQEPQDQLRRVTLCKLHCFSPRSVPGMACSCRKRPLKAWILTRTDLHRAMPRA